MKVRGIFGSIEARGKFGDIMVAFPWKDLQVIRVLKYPAQPRTPPQVAQRVHMSNAIAEMKASMYTDEDRRAQVRLASLRPKGETGPNQIVREYIRVARATLTWSRLFGGFSVKIPGIDQRLIIQGLGALLNVNVRYGQNIRYMFEVGGCIFDAPSNQWRWEIPEGWYPKGTRIYFQFYDGALPPAPVIGVTGIYSYVQT